MRLFIKIYADDLKSASSTIPLVIKGSLKDTTIRQLKIDIEQQISPSIKFKNQVLSIKKNGVILTYQMRLTIDDDSFLEQAGINENIKIHLQDQSILNKKDNKKDISEFQQFSSSFKSQHSKTPELNHIDMIMMKFIQSNQLFEFIDMCQLYSGQNDQSNKLILDTNRYFESIGKTYLHLAVENKSKQIISYLLFDAKVDPNLLTKDTQLAALHIAVLVQNVDIIQLLLTCDRTNINIISPSQGTPLHVACKVGSLKIIQQLLLNNADYTIKNSKQKLAKEVTINQRVVFLIEKYEKKGSQQQVTEEEEEKEDKLPQRERRASLSTQSHSATTTNSKQSNMEQIKEEEIEQEDQIELEAGNILDQASQFIKDFESSQIELVPTVRGQLLAQGNLKKKQKLRFFVLSPFKGQFVKFEQKEHYQKIIKKGLDFNKVKQKMKIEIIDLKDVMNIYPSFVGDFRKKNQHCIEMCFYNEQIIYLASFHDELIQQWLDYLNKAKRLSDQIEQIKSLLKEEEKLTEQMKFKLQEIIQFCENYCQLEVKDLQFIEQKQAEALHKQKISQQLAETNKLDQIQEEKEDDEEQQISSIPLEKVKFKDFEILEMLGEGSFGRVFKVRKLDTGQLMAMKAMKKQYLVMNNQLKYAISESIIMKKLEHPYILKMLYTFQTPSHLYMVSELCENGDLANHLDHLDFLDEQIAKFILAELILAISYIHTQNILYRDLKPENILIDEQGHIRLADFGLAKQSLEGKQMRAQSFCGSPAYLAPEMIKQQGVTESGDVYQIGVVFYEMIVGIPPYYDDNIKVLYQNIEKGKLKIPKYLSNESKNFLLRVLNKNPKKRPNLQELKSDPYFKDIDWQKLQNKELLPPWVLTKSYIQDLEAKKLDEQSKDKEMQELEALFHRDNSINIEKKKLIFDDQDYTESNIQQNRVRNYSFSRSQQHQ